ncbi:MAG TPA: TetR family transcriptional regulator [Thermoanaerobaculia bacterium]|jgi:AcrR family transcriptional regulator
MGRPPRISRDQILDAARAAFSARGFAATTLADIAGTLEVTPAAILRHFDSKQALFSAAMSTRDIAIPEFFIELATVDASTDPRIVLRDFAKRAVPFVSAVIRPAIAVQMHSTTVVVPFDTQSEDVPPRRALRILSDYFARAMKAGTIRRAEPHALALLFMGQIQAYVFIHQVLDISPAYPLDSYIDALIALWSDGVFGGTRAQETDPGTRSRPGRSRDAAVPARAENAKAARPRRNAGGKDGERGVAGRRPRGSRPRR